MFLECQFPIYEIRKYVDKFEEGNYIVIQTNRTRWVLDYKYKTDDDYAIRRMKLKTDPLCPYKVYPLYKMHRTIGQVIRSKHREFIDSAGRMIKYKPAKFYTIKIAKIRASWLTQTGHRAYKVLETNKTFVSIDGQYTHIAYVEVGRRTFLIDLITSEELPEFKTVRTKI